MCVCCVLYIGRIAVAADLSFSYTDASERQSPERKRKRAKRAVELNLSERSGGKMLFIQVTRTVTFWFFV